MTNNESSIRSTVYTYVYMGLSWWILGSVFELTSQNLESRLRRGAVDA